MPPLRETRVKLKDGRNLGVAEFGDPSGRPVLYFHGYPGSRLEAGLAHEEAALQGVRLIGVDRPGIGLSDFQDGRSIPDWPSDVAGLADALGLPRFAAVGVSGGGPYALACARLIPERLTAAGVVAGLGPVDEAPAPPGMMAVGRLALSLPVQAPWAVQPLFQVASWGLRAQAGMFVDFLASTIPEPDRSVLADPDVRRTLAASQGEAMRQGPRGATWELGLYSGPWGFRLEDVAFAVDLWHGERDAVVPAEMGRAQAKALPRCRARFFPEEGHFSLPIRRIRDILDAVPPAAAF
ncbi:MAG: alpha/beta hydrolase [Planctomycetes bacterium]|jgi:pimeloyl-ACP methyl ester carboxylesterase|nr:alpha/beta hydrolase [Planctomycetota bacterium]